MENAGRKYAELLHLKRILTFVLVTALIQVSEDF